MRLWGTSFAHAFLLAPRRASPPTLDATKPRVPSPNRRTRCNPCQKTSLTTTPPTPNATEARISGQKCRVRCSREQKTSLTTAPPTPHATQPRVPSPNRRIRRSQGHFSQGHFAKISHLLSGCERPGRHHPHCWTAQCIGLPQQRQRERSPWRTTSRRT